MIATNKSSYVVIDAGFGVLQVIADPRSEQAATLWSGWIMDGIDICAPDLWLYETTSVLHKISLQQNISEEIVQQALEALLGLNVAFYEVVPDSCRVAYRWATRLKQSTAYDGFYMALAERLNAELWTTDQRLVNRARQIGVSWVHWIGE